MPRAWTALAACGLGLTASAAWAGEYYCGGRPVGSLRSCPDGEPAMYRADPVPEHRAVPVRPVSQADLDRMNEATKREAAKLARVWAADGRLSRDQVEAIARGTCILMPFANPELRCVTR